METPTGDGWRGRDPDDALRDAIHAAVDAGDLDRAEKLIEVLRGDPVRGAGVVNVDARRRS